MSKSYFEGYYIKIEGVEGNLIFIPSIHQNEKGERWAQLQIGGSDFQITIKKQKWVHRKKENSFYLRIGKNVFTNRGCRVLIEQDGKRMKGQFSFASLTPIRYDIMGPFRYIPFLQCRHSIYSMYHKVQGVLECNQARIQFRDAIGYIEGDRGKEFPKKYFWTQASLPNKGSVFLSIATIPLLGGVLSFSGSIAIIFYEGREYRLATYLGARIKKQSPYKVILTQGNLKLYIRLLPTHLATTLEAPKQGEMNRTIKEHITCSAMYTFTKKNKVLFNQFITNASAESEFPLESKKPR